jgi:hypothetical protein
MLDRDFEEGGGIFKLIFLHCFPVWAHLLCGVNLKFWS